MSAPTTHPATPLPAPSRPRQRRKIFRPSRPEKLVQRGGLRAAIDAMCRRCIASAAAAGAGGWRQRVERCASRPCPLWPVRPRSEQRGGAA